MNSEFIDDFLTRLIQVSLFVAINSFVVFLFALLVSKFETQTWLQSTNYDTFIFHVNKNIKMPGLRSDFHTIVEFPHYAFYGIFDLNKSTNAIFSYFLFDHL